jgi:hypothetical protein
MSKAPTALDPANAIQVPTDPPIVANASPVPEQMASALRQLILALASIATALGYSKAAGDLSLVLDVLGPLAAVIVIVLGQLKTRKASQNTATLAAAVPDSIAVVK